MNVLYAKSVLYAYPCLDKICEQIDELVEKRLISSMYDFSPAEEQCIKIVNYGFQKQTLLELKQAVIEVLKKFTQIEVDYLDYKYFKLKPKSYYKDFDAKSRNYFRNQIKICEKFSLCLERLGFGDEWFNENCLKIDFFKELLKRVKEQEEKIASNKRNAKKPVENRK
ncbi:MAG: hypothetical protein E7369_03880, partial [Clostridiales bacterium]|nr:hypothetical protein [Clostridiales bacterium]